MTSVLTRHLYILDEVVSALQVCLRFRRNDEAPFWLWELVRSDEPALAYQTLYDSWMDFGGGYFAPQVLNVSLKTMTDTAWLQLLSTVIQAIELAGTASSVPLMRATATTNQRPRQTPLKGLRTAIARPFVDALDPAEGMTRSQAAMWFLALHAAIRTTPNPADAAWLMQAAAPILSADAVWSALQLIHDATGAPDRAFALLRSRATPHPLSQTQTQITVALRIMHQGQVPEPPLRPHTFSWADYDAKLGRRAARRYPIPPMALHAGTTRGQLAATETTIATLRDPREHLAGGCAFWRAALGKIKNPASEEFHAAYFPDDIPDEWSAEDQQKSHGVGLGDAAPPPPPPAALREEPIADLDIALNPRWSTR